LIPLRGLLAFLAIIFLASVSHLFAYDFSGEELGYEFGWNGITAADASVKIVDKSCGEPCQSTTLLITGRKYLDMFWRVRDRLESLSTKPAFMPRNYVFYQREGQFNMDTSIELDQQAAHLRGKRFRLDKQKHFKDVEMEAQGLFDPISALLFIRSQPLQVGDERTIKVFDGKRVHWLNYKVLGTEKIKIKLGEFDTIKVAPRIIKSSSYEEKGKVEKVRQVTIWMTDSPAHTILRIESEAFVGHIFAELVKKN